MNKKIEDYYNKQILEELESDIKNKKKKIILDKVYFYLCLFNIIAWSINGIINYGTFKMYLDIVITFIWIINTYIIFNEVKLKKNVIKIYESRYLETLKIIDYSKYIKIERIKKLKKLID